MNKAVILPWKCGNFPANDMDITYQGPKQNTIKKESTPINSIINAKFLLVVP